ncbi:Protein C06G3.6 [Aphelenchoides avenae]|nr:Protein C06G3.6 [Aphelenchus avenae]
MNKVLFQWVDGGILRQFQLEKDTVQYRILMAVVKEVKQSLDENAAVAAQTFPASNEVQEQQADHSSPPPTAVSPLAASVSQSVETPAVSRAPRKQQARSEPPTRTSTPGRESVANKQWAFCNHCKAIGGKSQHIYGTRFKCAVCTNFDLCEACEASGVHAHHVMLRIGLIVKDVSIKHHRINSM